jgi:hypothetical protein
MSPKQVVVITGAGGQTGEALFRLFLNEQEEVINEEPQPEQPRTVTTDADGTDKHRPMSYYPLGVVRTEDSKQRLVDAGVPSDHVVVCDVTDVNALKQVLQTTLSDHHHRIAALCICTSATPAPTGETNPVTGRPIFGYPNGDPKDVDWIGQKNQIDAVNDDSRCHIVLCSSMGGTNPDHPLNALGRKDDDPDSGNILLWKRKAEVYLIQSGAPYTIVHPGGLVNEPGGQRELIVGVDDETTNENTDQNYRTIPRQDVARVMMEAVKHPDKYIGRSFDVRSKPVGDGIVTTDFRALIDTLQGRNCDYNLGTTL